MDVLKAIETRRSVRQYTDGEVAESAVRELLKAGMQAPTAVNRQPCHFIVVREGCLRAALAEGLPYAKMAAHAPVVIVVCADARDEPSEGLLVEDASAATQNILLAAHGMGLGAVWATLYPYPERMEWARKTLGIPETILPLALVPVGWPAHAPKPEDRFRADRVHEETW